jgi:excinuclease ABC subunit C
MPKRPCLRYHINLCDAPCINLISTKDYENKIKKVKMILNGKSKDLLKKLEKEMDFFSNKQDFEHALQIRNEIGAITNLSEKQKMQREKKFNEDILNYEIKNNKIYLILFNIYKGTLTNKNEFVFDYQNNFLEDFLIQFYSENPIPREIILPDTISKNILLFLEKLKKKKITLTVPKKGDKKRLLELVSKNIENTFFANIEKVEILKKKLNLNENPFIIECFDISHLSGTSTVGSMVQFRNGKPDKNNYRRFNIRTISGVDDTAAISEIVRRRYTRLKKENTEFPDLIIIDGGKGQLNCALKELKELDIKIPVISIAKQFEEIYIPGILNPLILSKKDKALHFIQEIRDEAHRFAIKYNRLLRMKKLIE